MSGTVEERIDSALSALRADASSSFLAEMASRCGIVTDMTFGVPMNGFRRWPGGSEGMR